MKNLNLCIYILLIIVASFLIFNPYKEEKKNAAFEKMALTLLDSKIELNYLENSNEYTGESNNQHINNNIPKEDEMKPNTTSGEKYIGVLKIPKINLERGFFDKDSNLNTVNKNIMILSESSYPDEQFGNTILAAHNGNTYISYFRRLSSLEIGDIAYLKYDNYEYQYKLANVYTQPKTGTLVIYRNNNKTTLTLITCTENSDKLQSVYIFEKI